VNTVTLIASNGGVTTELLTGTVQITVSDFTVSVATATATVSAGQTANDGNSLGSDQ